jgi:hypothetical protein
MTLTQFLASSATENEISKFEEFVKDVTNLFHGRYEVIVYNTSLKKHHLQVNKYACRKQQIRNRSS